MSKAEGKYFKVNRAISMFILAGGICWFFSPTLRTYVYEVELKIWGYEEYCVIPSIDLKDNITFSDGQRFEIEKSMTFEANPNLYAGLLVKNNKIEKIEKLRGNIAEKLLETNHSPCKKLKA